MSEGQRAADEIKSDAHKANAPFENVRQNINSFADNLVGDKRSHSSRASGIVGDKQPHGTSGIHPDAEKTAEGIAHGTGALVGKAEDAINKHKKT